MSIDKNTIAQRFSLEGKKAYITGGAQGIGSAVADAFAQSGADVAIVDIDEEKAQEKAKSLSQYNIKSIAVQADVSNLDDVQRMGKEIIQAFGRVDIAFNNAGICTHAPAEDMSLEMWNKVMSINLTGIFLTCQIAGKIMISQRSGSIINTASMSAHIVNYPQQQCAYNASKAGVIQLTRSLAVEWAPHNIRVNSLSPGYLQTPLTDTLPIEWREKWMEQSNMKRMGTPEDLQAIVVYLAGDGASFTTGSDFIIDGGFTCR